MKKIYVLLFSFIIFSCNTNRSNIEIIPQKNIQHIVDSIIELKNRENYIYELFVDKTVDYRCDMVLHIGKEPYYKNNKFPNYFFQSNNEKVTVYSGLESYFGLKEKDIHYGENNSMYEDEYNYLWIIHLYKDSIVEVYSASQANPFLLIPASPQYFVVPEIKVE